MKLKENPAFTACIEELEQIIHAALYYYEQKIELKKLFQDCEVKIKIEKIYVKHHKSELFKKYGIIMLKYGDYIFSVGMAYAGCNIIQMAQNLESNDIFFSPITIKYNY